MLEILLGAIVVVGLLIAFALYRLGDILDSVASSQADITEALWARTGYSRSEWRERRSQASFNEFERESWEKFQRERK
jgi:hypothetical protein